VVNVKRLGTIEFCSLSFCLSGNHAGNSIALNVQDYEAQRHPDSQGTSANGSGSSLTFIEIQRPETERDSDPKRRKNSGETVEATRAAVLVMHL